MEYEFNPTDFAYSGMSDETDNLVAGLKEILIVIFLVVGAAASAYCVFLAFKLAKAENENARKEAKDRIIKTFAGVFIIIFLFFLLFNNVGGFYEGTTNRAAIGKYSVILGGTDRKAIYIGEEFTLGFKVLNDGPAPAKVVFYEKTGVDPYSIGVAGDYKQVTKVRGEVEGESKQIVAYFFDESGGILDTVPHTVVTVARPPNVPPPPPPQDLPPGDIIVVPDDQRPTLDPGNPTTGGADVGTLRWPFNDTQYTKSFPHVGNPRKTHLRPGDSVRYHAGIDIFNAKGTPVYAAANGVIASGGNNATTNDGGDRSITIKLDDKVDVPTLGSYPIWMCYVHIDGRGHSSVGGTKFNKGDKVKKGDLIGHLAPQGGKTDNTSPHLHLEVSVTGSFSTKDAGNYDGSYTNPPPTLRDYELKSGRLHPMRLYNPSSVKSTNKLPTSSMPSETVKFVQLSGFEMALPKLLNKFKLPYEDYNLSY